jgi:heme/copper-type cytochrome/quinol oxidase subunit 1
MLQLLTKMVFFGMIHMFLQLSYIGLYGTKRAYIHLEKHELQKVLLSETNSGLTGKQCA